MSPCGPIQINRLIDWLKKTHVPMTERFMEKASVKREAKKNNGRVECAGENRWVCGWQSDMSKPRWMNQLRPGQLAVVLPRDKHGLNWVGTPFPGRKDSFICGNARSWPAIFQHCRSYPVAFICRILLSLWLTFWQECEWYYCCWNFSMN